MKLSIEQQNAIKNIREWYKETSNEPYVLSGYAGTGKTTLAKHIAGSMRNVIFCAYTGKAANVLNDKGCKPASTIHSILYQLIQNRGNKDPLFEYNPVYSARNASLIIVDEFSMLPNDMIIDLLRTNNKVLFLGDPFQLPPIKGVNSLKPNMVLTQVHRQALESPILRAATNVREGKRLDYSNKGDFIYMPKNKIDQSIFMDVSQLITGRRKTRDDWNTAFMKNSNLFHKKHPIDGQKVICTRNNKRKGLINGMIGHIQNLNIVDDICKFDFKYQHQHFLIKTKLKSFKDDKFYEAMYDSFYHGYAITCHKSQGSEFDSIAIMNEPVGKTKLDCQRWLYTAITRAKNKCYLVDKEKQ